MDYRAIRSWSPSPSIGTTKCLEEDYCSREIAGSEGSNRRRRRRGETLRDSAGGFAAARRAASVFVRRARTHTHTQVHTYTCTTGRKINTPYRPTDRPTDPPTRRRDATRHLRHRHPSSSSSFVSIHPPPAWLSQRRRGRRDRDKRSAARSTRDWVRAGQESEMRLPSRIPCRAEQKGIFNRTFLGEEIRRDIRSVSDALSSGEKNMLTVKLLSA